MAVTSHVEFCGAPGAGQAVTQSEVRKIGWLTHPDLNKKAKKRAFHDAIEISRWRASPWGAEKNKEAPSKRSRGSLDNWPEVTKTLHWFKHPKEDKNMNTNRGDEKHPNETNKSNKVMEKNLLKINVVRWTPPNRHLG